MLVSNNFFTHCIFKFQAIHFINFCFLGEKEIRTTVTIEFNTQNAIIFDVNKEDIKCAPDSEGCSDTCECPSECGGSCISNFDEECADSWETCKEGQLSVESCPADQYLVQDPDICSLEIQCEENLV